MIKLKDLLVESKQSIVNLGYPEIIAKLIYEKFGEKSYTISRWFREYTGYANENNWFKLRFFNFSDKLSLYDYVELYNASFDKNLFLQVKKRLDLSTNDIDESELIEQRNHVLSEMKKLLFDNSFFKWYKFINNIMTGIIRDIKQYEHLSFDDAVQKFEEKELFSDKPSIKTYSNGYKWIHVGKKCAYIAKYMKNCGSSGLMTFDENGGMVVLFDSNNKPHVVTTYSPEENRISGIEGVGSTEIKDEYIDYVLDLTKVLNAHLEHHKLKSTLMKLKYLFMERGIVNRVLVSKKQSDYDQFFTIKINNILYYSNGFNAISKDNIKKAISLIKSKTIKLRSTRRNVMLDLFNHYNEAEFVYHGIEYKTVESLAKSI